MNPLDKYKVIEKLDKEFETIDFINWLLFSREMNFKVIRNSNELEADELRVNNLKYNNRIYTMNYVTAWFSKIKRIAVTIKENEEISQYEFAVPREKYEELIKTIYKNAIKNIGTNKRDEDYKVIIEFLNSLFKERQVFKEPYYRDFR